MDDVDSALADNVKSFAAGGFGGICAVLTGHPFDLVKVRLQTGLYNSSVQCVKQTIAKDGLTGLYRGFYHHYWESLQCLLCRSGVMMLVKDLFQHTLVNQSTNLKSKKFLLLGLLVQFQLLWLLLL